MVREFRKAQASPGRRSLSIGAELRQLVTQPLGRRLRRQAQPHAHMGNGLRPLRLRPLLVACPTLASPRSAPRFSHTYHRSPDVLANATRTIPCFESPLTAGSSQVLGRLTRLGEPWCAAVESAARFTHFHPHGRPGRLIVIPLLNNLAVSLFGCRGTCGRAYIRRASWTPNGPMLRVWFTKQLSPLQLADCCRLTLMKKSQAAGLRDRFVLPFLLLSFHR